MVLLFFVYVWEWGIVNLFNYLNNDIICSFYNNSLLRRNYGLITYNLL